MSDEEYFENVKIAEADLNSYSDKEIKSLAVQMGVNPVKSKQVLCRKIAQKLMYANHPQIPLSKCKRYQTKLELQEISEKREIIYNEFQQFKNSVTSMNSDDLMNLFKRYDAIFYDDDISKFIEESNYSLTFKTSGTNTFTTEGKCANDICEYTITIPVEKFDNVKDLTIVAGHTCKDQLECLLRVMEHEISHLIIFMFCGDYTVSDQHGKLFMNMVNDQFGHTDHRHYIF